MDCIGAGIGYDKALGEAVDFAPAYIVLNTSTPTIDSDLSIAKRIKTATGAKVIAYGTDVTVRYKDILSASLVDYAILGDPETPIMRVLSGDFRVAGVATDDWDGGVWSEPDLDALPLPAYDLLPVYRYPLTMQRWMFIRTGRGCPFGCIFCIEPTVSPRPRVHSVKYMIRQIKWVVDELHIPLMMFWEEVATLDRKHMLTLCEEIVKEGLQRRFKWFCTTRADRFDDEIAKKMAQAGCRMVAFGLESGNQAILDRNGKGLSLTDSKGAVLAAKNHGILTIGHFIIGLVGETPETVAETSKFARELGLDFAQFYAATPFPGTKFHELAIENGWLQSHDSGVIQQGLATVSYPGLSMQDIQRHRRWAYLRFYLRPQAIYSSLKARSLRGILELPSQALKFSGWALK
jgi:radical SAM superfamily enzyme YgiQ (UPF0313 family)